MTKWDDDNAAGDFPRHAAFVFMDELDPQITTKVEGFTSGSYDNISKTRVSGLGEDGFSIINTGSGNTGFPEKSLGGFLLSVNPKSQNEIRLAFRVSTIKANDRKYGIILKYRIGDKLPFQDFKDEEGERVLYYGSEIDNDEKVFKDLKIEESLKEADYIQLFWQYFYTEIGSSGPRDELRIDDIEPTGILFF